MLSNTGLYKALQKGEESAKAYVKHYVQDVKRFVPKNRLLIMKRMDGWDPICKFLNLPVPNEPFPHRISMKDAFYAYGTNVKLIRNTLLFGSLLAVVLPFMITGLTYLYLSE